jgi:hypothetical protein
LPASDELINGFDFNAVVIEEPDGVKKYNGPFLTAGGFGCISSARAKIRKKLP